MEKRKVLVTGAGGIIATRIISELKEKYDLRMTDIRNINSNGEPDNDIQIADLLEKDRDIYRHLFKGVDTVIHSAFVRAKANSYIMYNGEAFSAEMSNVQMAYNVYQTCVEEDVKRVVVISSNHATDYYEGLIHQGKMACVTPEMAPYSDNYYGWAKISYEAMGFVFAVGKVNDGRKLQNVQIRIGAPRDNDLDPCTPGDFARMHRALGTYLSQRDELQLIVKSIEAESIEDENGIPFQIFYGISNNYHKFWDIGNAKRVIGYEPQDNSSIKFGKDVARITNVEQVTTE